MIGALALSETYFEQWCQAQGIMCRRIREARTQGQHEFSGDRAFLPVLCRDPKADTTACRGRTNCRDSSCFPTWN